MRKVLLAILCYVDKLEADQSTENADYTIVSSFSISTNVKGKIKYLSDSGERERER